jgi:hypothetical protein
MIVDTCTAASAGETKRAYLDDVSLQARFDYIYGSTQREMLNANIVFEKSWR